MGIGHFAAGLALGTVHPALNAGWLIFAAFLPDFLLGFFVLAGLETYQVPPDYAAGHYLLFTFPWSHSLPAMTAWAALAALLTFAALRRAGPSLLIAAAVLSHFLLDGLVHLKGLPLLLSDSPALGLGLWRNLPLELSLEATLTAAALAIYLRHRSGRTIAMSVYSLLLAALLIAGQATASAAPPREALIASWILSPILMAAIAAWLDRPLPPSHL